MNTNSLKVVTNIWSKIAKDATTKELEKIEIEIYKKMLNFFQVGDFAYMILNLSTAKLEYISEEIEKLNGSKNSECDLDFLINSIHPDDFPHFISFESTSLKFFLELPVEKMMKYKIRYNYRLRTKSGEYKKVLQQIMPIQVDEEGNMLRTFVILTDISHLKDNPKMKLSYIGFDGEPSYVDVKPLETFEPTENVLTNREHEILLLLSQSKTTKQISEHLCISVNTVATHRKNILKKTKTHNVLELVKKAIDKGWI